MGIPSRVDELTAGWFGEVLAADVTHVELLDAHTGTTGRARLALTGGAGVPASVFVKLQPFDPEQQEFLRLVGLGVSEARIYAAVGDELPVRLPRAWHADADDEQGAFVMVLEDLTAAGCHFPTVDDPDVLAVAESLVDELAALHAAYWGRELPWLPAHAMSAAGGETRSETAAMGAQIVASALDQFAAGMPPVFRRLGELYVDRYREIGALWTAGERTLVHGDPHIGNLFVDGGRTGFFDWAVAGRYAGMRDVAYFLASSLPPEVRRAEEGALVARYRSGLADRGVELSADLAADQYRLFAVYGWIAATTTAAMGSRWQPAEVGQRAMRRTTEAIADLDAVGLLTERLGPG